MILTAISVISLGGGLALANIASKVAELSFGYGPNAQFYCGTGGFIGGFALTAGLLFLLHRRFVD